MTLSLKSRPASTSEPFTLDRFDSKGTFLGQLLATPEQTVIIRAAINTKDSLIVEALAGGAKTSTIEFICKYHPIPTLCLAFNKKIAEEMTARLPSSVTCRTMNSIGHRVWGTAVGRRLAMDFKKSYNTLTAVLKDLNSIDRAESYETFADTLRMISFAKRVGYVPPGKWPTAHPLMSQDDFHAALEEPPTLLQSSLVDEVLNLSIRASYAGTIDFDDQIYMPTLFGGSFPKFPLVMVDEAQDLSEINHAMLRKLVSTRLIAVGDPYQSIYGFRGARHGGMGSMEREFNCRPLPLSVSFRCPQAIVEYVRSRVPHMQWRHPGGTVGILDNLCASSIPDGAAIICRNNAPLFELALRLLAAGRGVHLVGTDLGPALIKILRKLGPDHLTQQEALDAIEAWKSEKLEKARNRDAVEDRAECLRVFVRFGATLSGAIAYAEHVFATKGPIQLLSGHKSKGLEFSVVYHLDSWRIPSKWAKTPEELEQEANLAYVVATRAKESYYEIDADRISFEDPSHGK